MPPVCRERPRMTASGRIGHRTSRLRHWLCPQSGADDREAGAALAAKTLSVTTLDQTLRTLHGASALVGKARKARTLSPERGVQVRGPRYDIRCQRQTTMHQGAPRRRRQTRPMAAPEAGDSLRSGHAVVLGGSMAGLLAARALADRFSRVTVVERDAAPAAPDTAKACPRTSTSTSCWPRRATILERFFPGLKQELLAAGAQTFDCGSGRALVPSWRVEATGLTPACRCWPEPAFPRVARPAAACGAAQRGLRRGRRDRTVAGRGQAPRARGTRAPARWLRRGRGVPGRTCGRNRRPRKPCPEVARRHGIPTADEETVVIDLGYATRVYQRPPQEAGTGRC